MSFDKPATEDIDGSGHSYLVVAASYNGPLVDAMLAKTIEGLKAAKVAEKNIDILRVPGSAELPWAIQLGIETGDGYDCCIALGVLIRGDTSHFQHIAQSVTDALQMVALNHAMPVVNGVVVAENPDQAKHRTTGELNRGAEFAACGLALTALRKNREQKHEQ